MFSSGSAISSEMLDGILTSAFKTPELILTLRALCGAELSLPEQEMGGHLRSIEVPDEFVNLTFGQFYTFLAQEHGIIPIGLFRNKKCSNHKNSLPYVLPNPLWCFLLQKTDHVYVLGDNMKL